MQPTGSEGKALAAGLLALSAVYAAALFVLAPGPLLGSGAHPFMFGAMAVVALAVAPWLWRRAPASAAAWWGRAAYMVLGAAIFAAENRALPLLGGVTGAHIDASPGPWGLELWFVLCPSASAVCVGGAVRAWCRGAER